MIIIGAFRVERLGRTLGRLGRDELVPIEVAGVGAGTSSAGPRRDRATMTWRTLGQASAASAATGSRWIALPRRNETSAVTSATAWPSSSRAATAWAPKPEKIGIHDRADPGAGQERDDGLRAPSAGTARPGRPGRSPAAAARRPGGRSRRAARHRRAGGPSHPHPPRSRQCGRGATIGHGDRGNDRPD